ncbi:hypothetical protein DFP73DRAFT_529419 [Morchella snyderi]|nr:hypothetical protein DFP73DRAFT_529419 [Morchella snyderi]
MAGFVLQFVGLRSMSWHASIAQLVATIIMKFYEHWLATRISNRRDRDRLLGRGGERPKDEARSWRSVFLERNKENESPIYPWNDSNSDHFWDKGPFRFEIRAVGDFSRYKKLTAISEYPMGESMATGHIDARISLGVQTGWSMPALDQAIRVASAIEAIMDAFFPKSSDSNELVWSISDALVGDIRFNLSLVNSVWKVDLGQIEAFLSLWLFSVSEKELQVTGSKTRNGTDKGLSGTIPGNHSLRLLAPKSRSQLQWMHWWHGGAIALVKTLIPSFQTPGTDGFQIDLKTPEDRSYNVVHYTPERWTSIQNLDPQSHAVPLVEFNLRGIESSDSNRCPRILAKTC